MNSPLSGIGLYWRTLATRWSDWDAVRLVRGSDGKSRLQHVDVAAIKRRRAAVRALLAAVIGATLYKKWDVVSAFAQRVFTESGAQELLQRVWA